MNNLGKLIKEQRTKQNLSFQDLSVKTGLSRMTLVRMEKRSKPVSIQNVIRVFKALNLTPSKIHEVCEN